jgi:hypothetical protein
MSGKQFAGRELEALEILERTAWRPIERNLENLETALVLLCEATQPALYAEEDAALMFGGPEELLRFRRDVPSSEEVYDFDDYERLLHVARLVQALCLSYGVDPTAGKPELVQPAYRGDTTLQGEITPPPGWRDEHDRGIAALLHGLNDLLDE